MWGQIAVCSHWLICMVCCDSWGCKESDTTEWLTQLCLHFHFPKKQSWKNAYKQEVYLGKWFQRSRARELETAKWRSMTKGVLWRWFFSVGNGSYILPGSFEVTGPLCLCVMGEDLFISSHSPLVMGCFRGWYLGTSWCVQEPTEQRRTYRCPPTR